MFSLSRVYMDTYTRTHIALSTLIHYLSHHAPRGVDEDQALAQGADVRGHRHGGEAADGVLCVSKEEVVGKDERGGLG